eukprot:14278427-Heterocapsa_arctica.AAC.1
MNAVTASWTLQSVIKAGGEGWLWANNEDTLAPICAAQGAAENAMVASSFAQLFLTKANSEVKKLYKAYSEDDLNKEYGAMSALLDPLIRALQKETSQLVNMSMARM